MKVAKFEASSFRVGPGMTTLCGLDRSCDVHTKDRRPLVLSERTFVNLVGTGPENDEA